MNGSPFLAADFLHHYGPPPSATQNDQAAGQGPKASGAAGRVKRDIDKTASAYLTFLISFLDRFPDVS